MHCQGGVPGQGGVPAQGVPAQVFSPCEQNDRQVKILPGLKLRLWAVINLTQISKLNEDNRTDFILHDLFITSFNVVYLKRSHIYLL